MSTPATVPEQEAEKQRSGGVEAAAAAGGGVVSHCCDFCGEWRALVHCRADDARLCLACDRHVHTANTVSSKHPRSPLCDSCDSSPASIFCCSHRLRLCHNCDFDAHRGAGGGDGHVRRPVEPYSGCPGAGELLGLLGVGGDEKSLGLLGGDEGGDGGGGDLWLDGGGGVNEGSLLGRNGWVWETPPVLSLDDLIVPTSAGHGYQALGVPPLPKDRNLSCGKHKDEILRQLRAMVKSELGTTNQAWNDEFDVEFQHSVSQQTLLSESRDVDSNNATAVAEPGSETDFLIWENDSHEVSGLISFSYDHILQECQEDNQLPDSINDSRSHIIKDDIGEAENSYISGENMPLFAPRYCYELSGPERDSAISRYREKRKTRRYDKHIRYESRKARAETRTRINGRFAKVNRDAKS